MPEHSARAELTPAQVDGSKPELADIFRRYGEAYLGKFGASLSAAQRRVMKAIQSCRTAALGGHVEVCDRCGHQTRVVQLVFGPPLSQMPGLGPCPVA